MATDALTVKVEFDEENAMNCIKNVLMEEYGMALDELAELCKAKQEGRLREDVQGKWIKSHWRGSTSCANCSVCDFEAQHSEFRGVQKYYKICPNCGARMTGGAGQ